MAALFAVAMLLMLLVPEGVERVRHTKRRDVARTSLVGLIALVGFVPLCVLLGISLFGIPLIPVAVLALLLASFYGAGAVLRSRFGTRESRPPRAAGEGGVVERSERPHPPGHAVEG